MKSYPKSEEPQLSVSEEEERMIRDNPAKLWELWFGGRESELRKLRRLVAGAKMVTVLPADKGLTVIAAKGRKNHSATLEVTPPEITAAVQNRYWRRAGIPIIFGKGV